MRVINKIQIAVYIYLLPLLVFAQPKKQAQRGDFNKWYAIQQLKLSEKANWFAYRRSNAGDSLYLTNTEKNNTQTFADIQYFEFAPQGERIAIQSRDKILIGNLQKKIWQELPWKELFYWSATGNTLLWNNNGTLGLYDLKTSKNTFWSNITSVFVNPDLKWAVYTTSDNNKSESLYVLDMVTGNSQKVYGEDVSNFFSIRFDETLKGFTCGITGSDGDKKILVVKYCNKKWKYDLLNIEPDDAVQWNGNEVYSDLKNQRLFFFGPERTDTVDFSHKSNVKILHSMEHPEKSSMKSAAYYQWVLGARVQQLKHKQMDEVVATSDPRYFIGYDTKPYDLRDNNGIVHADFYLIDGMDAPKLIESDLVLLKNHFVIAPHYSYAAYYKDGFWWSYNFDKKEKKCLTANRYLQFEDSGKKYLSSPSHYGVMGWTRQRSKFLVYDSHDIWELSLDKGKAVRITAGKEKGWIYRSVYDNVFKVDHFKNNNFKAHLIDTEEDVLVQARIPEQEEVKLEYLREEKIKNTLLDFTRQRILMAKKIGTDFLVKTESAEIPPKYLMVDARGNTKWEIVTNEHQKEYFWSKSEMITVSDNQGNIIRGSLHYPAKWDPSKSYPMVVYIYEQVAHWIVHYTLPVFENTNGFNKTLLTQDGYFVFLPDLRYERNEFGKFLSNDIDQLINAAKERENSINMDKLGIMGHSFGAYQVMYLVGQNNRFKAAVAGAGVSDLYDRYYSNSEKGNLGMFVFENMQYRSDEAYKNKKFELYNPLKFVSKINVPMLLWSGENDEQVRKEHSEKMYHALWRQKKEATLLIYKGEKHIIANPENQRDLTQRILNWLDEKLK